MNDIRPIRSYCGTPSLLLAAALLAAAGCNNSDATPITTGFITLQQGAPEVPYWDDAHDVLYIVDNTGNRVWKWTDELGANALAFAHRGLRSRCRAARRPSPPTSPSARRRLSPTAPSS